MSLPFVSVVLVARDCEKFLSSCLWSLIEQDLFFDPKQYFEIICVNDGSQDNSSYWLKEFYNAPLPFGHIRFFDHESTKGVWLRRNEAIAQARGKYIAVQDPFSLSCPSRLRIQADFLENNSKVFAVGGEALEIDDAGWIRSVIDEIPLNYCGILKGLRHPGRSPILDSTVMFRRDEFLALGGYTLEPDFRSASDLDLWCRVVVSGQELINLPTVMVHSRPHHESRFREVDAILAAQAMVCGRYSESVNLAITEVEREKPI